MPLHTTFARRVFLVAGIYGIAVLAPQYLTEAGVGPELPSVSRPELLYGFTGVALTWQFAFLLIARDVQRYRPLMLVAVLEKLSFGIPVVVLYLLDRTPAVTLAAGTLDLGLGALFVLAHRATRATAA